ncbi:uncharacterized protein LOC107633103 [Arachis ipaensis]|uniref:uncharacterized protein LOC107633103 n=1 Tax=Arachis ipaensis TaxID=130454 RepID=UPI0007AF5B88|nr:uncharacterized protein LOC107633103 [Arachis ipaensis]
MKYDGTQDPLEHLTAFEARMNLEGVGDEVRCRAFPVTLAGPAIRWFNNLPQGSVTQFSDISHAFLAQFTTRIVKAKHLINLLGVTQRPGEPTRKYLDRFNDECLEIDGLTDSVASLCLTNGLSNEDFRKHLTTKPVWTMQEIQDGKLADFSHLIREPRRRNRDNDNEDRSRPTRRRQEPEGDEYGLTVVNVVTARNTAPRSKSAQKKDAKVLAVSTSPVRSLKGLPPISFGPEDQWDRPPAHVASPGRKGRSQTNGPEKEENVAGKGGRGSQANGQPLRSGIHPGTGLLDLVVECGSG